MDGQKGKEVMNSLNCGPYQSMMNSMRSESGRIKPAADRELEMDLACKR